MEIQWFPYEVGNEILRTVLWTYEDIFAVVTIYNTIFWYVMHCSYMVSQFTQM